MSADATGDEAPEGDEPGELATRVELLEAENRRLREEYARTRRTQHRRTAAGMAAIGAVAVLAGILAPANRPVLFSLGAIGLFGALLTYYLTPERFVAATVGEGVYAAVAANGESIVAELGLSDRRLYVPREESGRNATLYVPQNEEYTLPEPDALEDTFIAGAGSGARGVSLHPTGEALFAEFERTLSGPLAAEPATLADQLADGLIEGFELADGVEHEGSQDGRAIGISGSAFGAIDRFDHPIASFLGVGFAAGLDRPVSVEVTDGDGRTDYFVVCSWEPDDGDQGSEERDAPDVSP